MSRLLMCSFLMFAGTQCRASIILSILPNTQSVSLGSQATFDVNIAGLGGGTAVGTYDINVGFDPALLSYTGISYGNQLDLFGLGDIQSVMPGIGTLEVFELSLESVSDLNTLQQPVFRLATLTFDTLAVGDNSPITLAINALGDASGNSITADLQNGLISISAPTGVPEPATWVLLACGLFLFVALKTSRAPNSADLSGGGSPF